MEALEMIRLIFLPEYLADTPIFRSDDNYIGHVEIEDLPVTERTKVNLRQWNNIYQLTFNENDPELSGFTNQEETFKYIDAGVKLSRELQDELGSGYFVDSEFLQQKF